MAVDFFIDPPTINIPSLQDLRANKWQHCPAVVRDVVAQEYQFFEFHLTTLQCLKFTAPGQLANKPWVMPLDWSVRAGAIKAAVLIAASILEAVLRAIAEHRGYPLPPNPRHRTFGKVLDAWEDQGQPRPDVAPIWATLQDVRDVRNNVHLFVAAANQNALYQNVLAREQQLLADVQVALDHVATVQP